LQIRVRDEWDEKRRGVCVNASGAGEGGRGWTSVVGRNKTRERGGLWTWLN